MPVRLKLASTPAKQSLLGRLVRFVLAVALLAAVVGAGVFFYFSHKYRGMVDDRLAQGPLFAAMAQVYAAPQEVRPGQRLSVASIAGALRHAGYSGNPQAGSQLGSYQLRENSILIKPGPESFLATDGATITTGPAAGDATSTDSTASAHGPSVVESITAENGAPLATYKLEPQLITALSEDKNRTKRRLVTYSQIPPQLVQAVTAIEDRRFFEHGGINYGRTVKCAFEDIIARHMSCGGSTITQQLARGFFLSPDKKLSRKMAEVMITFQLEARFNKQQIFEMYANQINLGQRGSFAINGFGEAAQSYFGKDIRQLTLPEDALLAGLIQNPNRRNPYRHPDRATERRNVVLDSMVETGAITADQAAKAKAAPLNLAPPNIDASEAPYFVDLVHEQIIQRLGDSDTAHSALRVYTSLDPDLQRAAAEAVEVGMRNVDDQVRRREAALRKKGNNAPISYPQVALVALNPHTGQILALIGGRNYGVSQLDHAVAERPTGSIFKPFVYAAAYNTSLNGTTLSGGGVFTALTKLNDDAQDFGTNGQSYIPGNFDKNEYPGMVTAADALAHSLNIATIALAQQVGYENVATLAHAAGIVNAKPTPSMAIGTYSATPIDMAGAYTTFANNGVHLKPWVLASVRNAQGDIVADFAPEAKQVLDPRTAYLTQTLLEGVMARGTAAGVRSRGFTAPAAGKTGTSHDAWFAGYSSNLLCIIWVGNDDYTDVKLEGAKAAAPIWAEFMNRAIRIPQYSDMKTLGQPPDGVELLRINRATDLVADDSCPSDDIPLAFLSGTAPQSTCSHMGESSQTLGNQLYNPDGTPSDNQPHRNIFQKLFGIGKDQPQSPPGSPAPPR
jgi:penicillin-binding protein 1B